RTDVDPEAQRHRAHVRHPLGDETDAVAQRGPPDGVRRGFRHYRRPGPPRRRLRRGPPPPRPAPPPPPPPPPPVSAGPRSPNRSLASPSKVSSKDANSRAGSAEAVAPPPVSPDEDTAAGTGSRLSPPALSSPSPTGVSDTLPWGSMSSTRTVTSSPRLSTSSTLSTRLP